jgi:chromosome segregation ATPase
MNHAEYEYLPTERLNFLNGSNGSGKSAVLTAIVFALGNDDSDEN